MARAVERLAIGDVERELAASVAQQIDERDDVIDVDCSRDDAVLRALAAQRLAREDELAKATPTRRGPDRLGLCLERVVAPSQPVLAVGERAAARLRRGGAQELGV